MNTTEMKISHPSQWPTKTINEACELVSRGTAPSYVEHSAVLVIGQRCVREVGFQSGEARFHDQRSVTRVLEVRKGDVLLNSTGTGTIGRSCIFNADGVYIVDGHVTLLRSTPGQLDGRWLNALFQSPQGQIYLETQCYSGSTNQVELSRRHLLATSIPLPPLLEQRRIAEILDTIDEAIQKTEALISKLKAMKHGLLHDLLTGGLDENGKLRDPKAHPEQFKDSPLGRIPEKWGLEPLYRLVLSHKAGIFKPMSEYGEGSRIVGVSDLFQHEYISDQPFRLVRLSKAEKGEYFLNRGDLLYAESSLVFDGIAKTLAVTEDGAGTAFAWHTRKLSVNKYRINYKFLAFALDSSPARSFVRTRATQTALTGIPVEAYLETPVPIPDIDEQHRIVKALDMLSFRINTEEQYRDKLKFQKKGLMHDLLTGKVRAEA